VLAQVALVVLVVQVRVRVQERVPDPVVVPPSRVGRVQASLVTAPVDCWAMYWRDTRCSTRTKRNGVAQRT